MSKKAKLSGMQITVLNQLDVAATAAAIAGRVGSLPGPVGRCADSLVKKGFAKKQKDGTYKRTAAGTKQLGA